MRIFAQGNYFLKQDACPPDPRGPFESDVDLAKKNTWAWGLNSGSKFGARAHSRTGFGRAGANGMALGPGSKFGSKIWPPWVWGTSFRPRGSIFHIL